jgi:hypothetical protein
MRSSLLLFVAVKSPFHIGFEIGEYLGVPYRPFGRESFRQTILLYFYVTRARQAGVWDRIMDALVAGHDAVVQMIDTSVVRVHQHRACIADKQLPRLRPLRGYAPSISEEQLSCRNSDAIRADPLARNDRHARSGLLGRRRDGLDLDEEFRAGKTGYDHQCRSRRRPGKLPVARSHIALHVLACGHIGVEAHDVGQRHAVFGENSGNIGEAKVSLRFAIRRDGCIGADAELARGHHQPVPRGHRDAVAVPGKGRLDRWR